MKTMLEAVRGLGKAGTIAELNSSYIEFILSIMRLREDGFFNDMGSFVELERNVAMIANNNIVRIARSVCESYEAHGRIDSGQMCEVKRCLDSLWGFDVDHSIEESLVMGYLDRMIGRS